MKEPELEAGDRVVYVFDGPDRTGTIVFVDSNLASIMDDKIQMRVSVNRKNVKQKLRKIWFENYQIALDTDNDEYTLEVNEFLTSNGIWSYAKSVMIPDGDRDGYTMVAELEVPENQIKNLNQSCLSIECPCDSEEHSYL